jgi:hypothetical protein
MRRRTLALLVVLAGVVACSTTTKYAAPPSQPGPADNCIAACQRGETSNLRKKDRKPIYDFDCLQKCPNIVVSEGDCEDQEKQAPSFCVQKTEQNVVLEVIGGVIALTFVVATIVFAVSK